MTEEDSQNLRDIKHLLLEINEKTSIYMRFKMMLEGEFGQNREARHEHVRCAQRDYWAIDEEFRAKRKE